MHDVADEVFDCMRDNDETSPKCKEAMQRVVVVDGRIVTDGGPSPVDADTSDVILIL